MVVSHARRGSPPPFCRRLQRAFDPDIVAYTAAYPYRPAQCSRSRPSSYRLALICGPYRRAVASQDHSRPLEDRLLPAAHRRLAAHYSRGRR